MRNMARDKVEISQAFEKLALLAGDKPTTQQVIAGWFLLQEVLIVQGLQFTPSIDAVVSALARNTIPDHNDISLASFSLGLATEKAFGNAGAFIENRDPTQKKVVTTFAEAMIRAINTQREKFLPNPTDQ